jgi:hypothetical protein
MSIRKDLLSLYPADWPEISHHVRFVRAGGRCELCCRPHGQLILCLPDGRWRALHDRDWYTGAGVRIAAPALSDQTEEWLSLVILATAHLDHDPRNNADENLLALCQRCHILHDFMHHQVQRRLTYLARYALGDLFLGLYAQTPYPAGPYPRNR